MACQPGDIQRDIGEDILKKEPKMSRKTFDEKMNRRGLEGVPPIYNISLFSL
jgi:hypothetical protein